MTINNEDLNPMGSQEKRMADTYAAERLFSFMKENSLLEQAHVKVPEQLALISALRQEDKERLASTRPSIRFETFPAENTDIKFDGATVTLVTLEDALAALNGLDATDRSKYTRHILSVLSRNQLAARLKEAPDDTTLYRWATPTEFKYGSTKGKWSKGTGVKPISFWRIPTRDNPYNINQWKGSDKELFVCTIGDLSKEGTIRVDVSDPEAIELTLND